MQTKKILVTITKKYARSLPHLPHLCLYEGQTLDVETVMADRVIELGGAEEVDQPETDESETDESETDDEEVDVVTAQRQAETDAEFEQESDETMDTEQSNMPDIEIKENPKKKGKKKKGNKK